MQMTTEVLTNIALWCFIVISVSVVLFLFTALIRAWVEIIQDFKNRRRTR